MPTPERAPKITLPYSPGLMLADIVSYGYAGAVLLAAVVFQVPFSTWQTLAIVSLFLALRWIASEIRSDLRRGAVREARRLAALRERAPSRWTAEQRDGIGRRLDASA